MFHEVYAFGLRTVVARLRRHAGVHSIYGCGSFFDGGCLYGHSDIDFIIVLGESAPRSEGVHYEVGRTYERVRRFFPFLGRWDEKAANLIFLDEVQAGFPLLDSFRVRMKQGRLVRLWGEPFPIDLGPARVTTGEIFSECDALVRTALVTGEPQSHSQLFWKRLFTKLQAAAQSIELTEVVEKIRAESGRLFGTHPDRALFFQWAAPERLCTSFLRLVAAFPAEVRRREEGVTLRFTVEDADGTASGAHASVQLAAPRASVEAVLHAAAVEPTHQRLLAPVPLGLMPQLFYFPADRSMLCAEIGGGAYGSIRRLLQAMRRHGAAGDALLVRAEGIVFVVSHQDTYTDVVPLHPLVHANVYAWIDGKADCTMPRSLYDEQTAEASRCAGALATMYARHEGWVPKASVPCVYREDDLDTIGNAFSMLRSLAIVSEPRSYLVTTTAIVDHYARRYPAIRPFLADLLADFRFHRGLVDRRPAAPNLYRCLHQFMRQALTGATTIELDDHHQGLAISVGIITRNRATDLRQALASLERLTRRPDEVVVVDNGSTDGTRAVIEESASRLPIRYVFLAEPSIPRARNLVIEHASHEVIAFTDDDCAVDPEWLTGVERGFMRADNIGIVGGWVLHWPAQEPTMVDTYYGLFHHNKL
ncbi:MAG: glycosyltransferase family 2 protein [Deltaproteobacteria bacterium]|nr:glycosyltransferase family 2 protein [Deltaproteobacteria bacterium]